MNPADLGSAFLWAALAVALLAVVSGRRKVLGTAAGLAILSTGSLAYALLTNDFALDYVVRTTSLATPWPYRVAAVWGGMEGSLLFYASLTLGISAAARMGKVAIRVAGAVGLGLLTLTVGFADPFQTLDIPAGDGSGLLAILQHPAMVYHPPILYVGLTSLVVPFALTVEMAVERSDRAAWRVGVRRWMYLSWTLLTLGMVAGANWAYIELGWGGYWAWDPVENTSLMPWLAATVFLHSSRIEESNHTLARWNVFMSGVPFALTVVGIYLTRSGATGSIHSFAEDPAVGLILMVATFVVMTWLVLISVRGEPGSLSKGVKLDRTGWLGIHTVLFSAVLLFVAAGSIYPAARSVFSDESVIVDTRFYVTTVLPIAVLISVSLSLSIERARMRLGLATAAGLGLGLLLYGPHLGLVLFAPALGSAMSLVIALFRRRRKGRQLSLRLAHLGMAIVLVGVAGSSFGDEFEGAMQVGDQVEVGGHTVSLTGITDGQTDRYIFVTAAVEVDGRSLEPQIRAYEDQTLPVAEPVVASDPVDDVIVAVSLLFPDGETVDVSVFVRPLVWWVWVGALLIVAAGLTFLFSKDEAAAERRRSAKGEPRQTNTTTGTDAL